MKPLVSGLKYAGCGVKIFFLHPRYWLYALVPIGIILVLYFLVGWFFCTSVMPLVQVDLEGLNGTWLSYLVTPLNWLVGVAAWLLFAMILAMVCNGLFEGIGGFWFPAMVAAFEKEAYGMVRPPLSWREELRFNWQSMIFSLQTWGIWLMLWLLSLFIMPLGLAMMAGVVGYRYALSYVFIAGFNQRLGRREMRRELRSSWATLTGFGIVIFLSLMIPIVPILLIPGFILGGAMLLHDEQEKKLRS